MREEVQDFMGEWEWFDERCCCGEDQEAKTESGK